MHLTQTLHQNDQQRPNLPSTVFGDRVRTHRETKERVARLAHALQQIGVASDEAVAILSLNSDRYAESLHAVAWADAIFVPVNTRWSVAEIVFSLQEAEVRVLIVDDQFSGVVAEIVAECPQIHSVIHGSDDGRSADGVTHDYEKLISQHEPIPDALRRGDQLAGIFYTGGTTGAPKGVMLSHRNLLTSAIGTSTTDWLPPDGRLLHTAPMFHLADLAALNGGSVLGNTHVIIPSFDPTVVLQTIEREKITAALLVPTMVQMIVDHPDIGQYDLSSFTNLIYGASPMPEALLERARRALPAARFVQAYGMTELSPVTTILLPEQHDDPVLRRSAGRSAAHSTVRILDFEDNEVPRGEVGEICSFGDHVMMGYWKRPEETAQALRGGWMHSGDGGYMDENGFVFLTDRLKDMIISGGENVYSIEVENVVATHPSVATCAVIGVPDEQWGERVHAVVVLAPGASLSIEELREHCRAAIAGYKCPTSLSIIDAMPLSGAGKILKRDLREQLASAPSADDLRDQ